MKGKKINISPEILSWLTGKDLQAHVTQVEEGLKKKKKSKKSIIPEEISKDNLKVLFDAKKVFGRIHEVIHAWGLLLCLDQILKIGETIENSSLTASARAEFDLVTDQRIAEFKFARWPGKVNASTKRGIINDYLHLLMAEQTIHGHRKKYLYAFDTDKIIQFLNGNQGMNSLLSKSVQLKAKFDDFQNQVGKSFSTIKELHAAYGDQIIIVDLKAYFPEEG